MSSSTPIRFAGKADLAGLQAIERAAGTLFPEGRIPDADDVMPIRDLGMAIESGLLLG